MEQPSADDGRRRLRLEGTLPTQADSASSDGYVHIKSETVVKNFVTESDAIWTCVYEPVVKKFPDLAIESIVATGKPGVVGKPGLVPTLSPIHARDVPTIIVVVKNVGDEAAFDFAVSLDLSPSRPEFAEESALLQLGPGKRITVAFTCPFLDPGTYEAYAFADCNEAVEEWDESDNNFKNIEFNVLE